MTNCKAEAATAAHLADHGVIHAVPEAVRPTYIAVIVAAVRAVPAVHQHSVQVVQLQRALLAHVGAQIQLRIEVHLQYAARSDTRAHCLR